MATRMNDELLSKFAIDYEPKEFHGVADQLLLDVPVKNVAGRYSTYPKFPSKLTEDEIGRKAAAGRIDTYRERAETTYSCRKRGHYDWISDDEIENNNYQNLARDAVYAIKKQLLINYEYRVKQLVDTSIAASGNFASPKTHWDDTSPTIEKDIRDAINAFWLQGGILPNGIMIPKQVWDAIVMDPTLRNVWLLVPGRSDQNIKLSSLMKLLFDNFEWIAIPDVRYDTAAKGKAEAGSYIWDDTVLFVYKGKSATTSTFTWASKFVYKTWNTKQWDSINPEGVNIRLRYEQDEREVCASCIYALTDVLK